MKFKIEKNIKIINELIAYFYKLGTVDVHIDLSSDNENSYFNIYGQVDSISKDELESLANILNTPRQYEVENYYWNLGGECEFDSELTLVGMMINSAKISYKDGTLKISIIREESK